MKKKLVKVLSLCLSMSMLILFCPSAAYAKAESAVTPSEYIFLTTLSSCGIYGYAAGGQWLSAYRGYLESIKDTTMLNQLNSYDNLSWGDTATGIDKLYTSIKSWLSLSDAYGTDARYYVLPSQASPQPDKITTNEFSIRSDAFTDINPIPLPDYEYLFSDLYNNTDNNGRLRYCRRNVYKPAGVEVFAITTGFTGYTNRVRVEFYQKDSSSANGYSLINVSSMNIGYNYDDDSLAFKDTSPYSWNWTSIDILSVMNFPFKVFSNTDDAKTYVQTGVANNLFSKDNCSLWWYDDGGVNTELQNTVVTNISSTMQLPADNATAIDVYHATRGVYDLNTATEKFAACGMEISYQDNYIVEHYKQSMDGNSWMITDAETLSGFPGDLATYTPKTYEGFTFDDTATIPTDLHIPGNGSLIIKLYYKRDEVDYIVEHYKQSSDGSSWMITDAETLSGLPGQPATYTPKSYEGFAYDNSSTTPDNPLILDDGSLIIKLFYKRNSVNYKVEHYQQNISGSAWTKVDTDSFTGLYGTAASCPAKSYTGFYCDTSLTVPDSLQLLSNNLTIKLYYKRISIDYTVNHYQQDLKNDSWTLVDTDTLTGLYGTEVKYTTKKYPGFACDNSLIQLPDKTLKEPLTVDLYYTRQNIAYTVEHYKGKQNEDMTINWTLAEKEKLSGLYGTKATYEHKTYTDYPYDGRLTEADNLDLLEDNKVVIKLYYVKPFGVGVIEDMVNSVADALTSAAWLGLGFITTGFVGLYCVKFYKNTVLEGVGAGSLTKKARATAGNMPKSKMSMRDKAMLKPSSGKKQTSRKS